MTQTNALGGTWQYFLGGTRSEEVDPNGIRHVLYTTPRGRTRLDIQDLSSLPGHLNLKTVTEHDGLDRPTRTTFPAGNSISYEYDLASNVTKVTRNDKVLPNPVKTLVTSAVYDPTFNKPIQITDPRGLVTTLVYDGAGNLLSVIANSTGSPRATTSYSWTGAGLPLTVTDPVGTVTAFAYDEFGNRLSTVEDAGPGRLNRTIAYGYNAWGDAISVTDPNGNITYATFNLARRPVETTTPATAAAPGGVGRPLATFNPAIQAAALVSQTYTPNGLRATLTDANTNTTNFTYDDFARLITIGYPAAAAPSPTPGGNHRNLHLRQ